MTAPKSRAAGRRCVYGPVPSRRLGFSLGVDVLPFKTCTLDCIYCQLGSVGRTTCRRGDFVPEKEVLSQIKGVLDSGQRVDHITFSGSGDPTLSKGIGRLIRAIKRTTGVPVAVLTNGTLLTRMAVRRDLAQADLVVPSLDAATTSVFRAVNRPHRSLDAARIIDGLVRFRREYKGLFWLEIMLVKGVNDSPAHIRTLKAAADRIGPDRIQLNTVVRPPAEASARPLTPAALERIRRVFGKKAEVVADFGPKKQPRGAGDLDAAIRAVVKRRPVTAADVTSSLGRPLSAVRRSLASLTRSGAIRAVRHGRKTFYEPA
jgi:wyosine [tRNA(Phe)-imidazoG37] synthetase (radical SAM superfamily)